MFLAKVKNFIQANGLISSGDSVLAAVSGGPDSVAMLNALACLSGELGFSVSAAHLNHGLRPEAPDEERFVLAACLRLGLECAVARVNTRSFAAASGCSLEEAGRELRHRFLAEQVGRMKGRPESVTARPESRTAQRESGTPPREGAAARGRFRVALGHTLDDQAETVLMRLIRGAGVRGLSAMRPVSRMPAPHGAAEGALLIRPLLSSTRQEILEFLHSRQIPYVEDASNFDLTFFRNRVRHELLGLLREKYNPGIVEVLGSQAGLLNEAEDYLTQTARKAYDDCVSAESAGRIELELARLVAYHVCVRRYVLREAYSRLCGTLRDVGFSHVESLSRLVSEGHSGDRVDLPHGTSAVLEGTKLVLGRREELRSDEPPPREFSVRHEPGGRTWLPEVSVGIESRVLRMEDLKECPAGTAGGAGPDGGTGADEVFFDLGALSLPLVLRNIRPGDRLSPFGMKGSKKVQDVLVDMKVPRRERRDLAALCDGSGMLWLVGVRRGSAAPVKDSTRLVLAVRTFAAQ